MKKFDWMKRSAAIVIMIALILGVYGFAAPVQVQAAAQWPTEPVINCPSAVVMEVGSGAVLYEKNGHDVHYPASITKILTTLLALENCELNETVVFGPTAVYKNEGKTSHIARDLNEEMSVAETLYGVMLESANECAYQIAEYTGNKLGGDVNTFIEMMNARAKALGCTDTHFNNPNGLPDEQHYTSAYDFALISCEAYRNETFREITGTKDYIIPPTNKHADPTFLYNHHKILHRYRSGNYVNPYCTGGKTGYTQVAKNTLVTFAERDGIELCVVVMYADGDDHYLDTNTLINYYLNNFRVYNISESDADLQTENARTYGLLNENRGFVTIESGSYIILPKDANFSDVKIRKMDNEDPDALAGVEYVYDNHVIGKARIIANQDVKVAPSVFETHGTIGTEWEELIQPKTNGNKTIVITPIFLGLVAAFVLLLVVLIIVIARLMSGGRSKSSEAADTAGSRKPGKKKKGKRAIDIAREKNVAEGRAVEDLLAPGQLAAAIPADRIIIEDLDDTEDPDDESLEKQEADEAAAKKQNAGEPDVKDPDTKEQNPKESDAKESNPKESNLKGSDAKESDVKESDAKESDAKDQDPDISEPEAEEEKLTIEELNRLMAEIENDL